MGHAEMAEPGSLSRVYYPASGYGVARFDRDGPFLGSARHTRKEPPGGMGIQ